MKWRSICLALTFACAAGSMYFAGETARLGRETREWVAKARDLDRKTLDPVDTRPDVLVEQTVSDGKGGTFTRIVRRPAGYVPMSATGVDPAPPPRAVAPPVITLPPEDMTPSSIALGAAGDTADYGHALANVPDAWKVTKGKGIKVAVLDTGIATGHKDLRDQILATKSFVAGEPVEDGNGHGTHCAGIIAAAENGWGMVGIAPEVKLLVGKVLSNRGSGGVDGIAAGIDWAVSQGADVISMSLGGAGQDSYLPPALDRATAAGVLVIVAAGNEGPNEGTVGFPGGYPQSIAIGAIARNKAVARFSSRGPAVFSAFAGVDVTSTYPGPGDGLTAKMSGTSMATPGEAGIAALWCAAHPEIAKRDRPAAYRKALVAASTDLGPAGRDTAYGYGLPDAAKLVAGGGTVPPPPPPPPPPPAGGWSGTVTYVYDAGTLKSVVAQPKPVPTLKP